MTELKDESNSLHLGLKDSLISVQDISKTPTLPKLNRHPNQIGPVGAKSLPANISVCKEKLAQIIQQIKDLYYEGPLVDGWLESAGGNRYILCGFDAERKMWTHPCPPEQLPSVSMAIANYQQLLHLLEHKRYLETFLQSLIHSSLDK